MPCRHTQWTTLLCLQLLLFCPPISARILSMYNITFTTFDDHTESISSSHGDQNYDDEEDAGIEYATNLGEQVVPWSNSISGLGYGTRNTYTRDFGTYVGRLTPQAHGIAGQVYAVDEKHLFVRNFRYDGTGPDAYFWVGDDSTPSPKGHLVPYPPIDLDDTGSSQLVPSSSGRNRNRNRHPTIIAPTVRPHEPPSLRKMRNENVLLSLPDELRVTDIRWLAIWCPRFTVTYGHVDIPKNISLPTKVALDAFPEVNGKLSSSRISIQDSESFYIPNFHLMIVEPGYHFWVGNSTSGEPNSHGMMVANEKARFDDLKTYTGEDIIITLQKGLTVYDINYLSIYSDLTKTSLGHVSFDIRNEKIPPALGQTKKPGWWFDVPTISPPSTDPAPRSGQEEEAVVSFNHSLTLPNCRELLGRKIRLRWLQEDNHVYFRLQVHMDSAQFAAVGIAAEGSPLIDADFVKIYFNSTSNQFQTEDSFLAKKMPCDFSHGLCPDVKHDSHDQVTYMGSMKNLGLSVIDFKRSILPKDKHDAPIPLEGPTHVIVAIGTQQTSGLSPYETSYSNPLNLEKENVTIDFSTTGSDCPDTTFAQRSDVASEEEHAWDKSYIKDKQLFVARLGPTGGKRGYGAITGQPPSEKSVCWWINGLLLPEIYVVRGKTYSFRVQGGNGDHHRDSFHPLYITSDREGGYGNKNSYEREREIIYSGVDTTFAPREPRPTGIGPLCEYVPKSGADKASESLTFEKYVATLHLACEHGREREYGWVNWTVPMDAPSLVFYQSYLDYGLGWKIHVLNEGEQPNRGGAGRLGISDCLLLLLSAFFWMSGA